jgi:HEAT repeat protein
VVGAGEIESGIFKDGAHRRGEEYVRARDVLVQQGPKLIPFLRQQADSVDRHRRMFAEILICRIQRPQDVARWDKALSELVNDRALHDVMSTYHEPDWSKLPKEPADVPASHIVDVLWETADLNNRDPRKTAAALQFYLAPHRDAVEAVIEIWTVDGNLKYPAREGLVKLGTPAVPSLRRVLQQTVPPPVKDTQEFTREDYERRLAFGRQMSRATVAARVLARLRDSDSVPLIVKCLQQGGQSEEYIESLCGALAEMKAVTGINATLDHLLASAAARLRRGDNRRPGYDVLRGHVVSFGKDALPSVKGRLQAAEAESDRIVLNYVAIELSGVAGKPLHVAALRESLWFDETASGLLKLHKMTGEDIFPRLAALARRHGPSRSNTDQRKIAMLTLGEMRENRAVPLLAGVLEDQHTYLQRVLKDRAGENAKGFDPQVARESADGFGRQDTYLAKVLDWGDTAILALRRIGSEDARKAVAAAAAYDEYKIRAETSVLLIDGHIEQIAERLNDDDRAVREEAALALLENGDPRATRELLCAAARRQGLAHQQWKQSALSSGQDISAELRELLDSEDVRQRVLAEAMLLESESPDKAARCRQSIDAKAQHIGMMHVIKFEMIEAAGRGLAARTTNDQQTPDRSEANQQPRARRFDPWRRFAQHAQPVDESHLPLVEAVCLFDRGVIRRGIAAFALAEWKKPRSMPVLAASFNMGSLGGSSPAAMALTAFGPEGAELAAKIPPPQPGRIDTGLHMTRHRTSARVLAEQQDIRGVDEILKGLKTLAEDPKLNMWNYRAKIYLTAAGKFHDQRLVDPFVRILSDSNNAENYVRETVIKLLAAYDDPRLIPLFAQELIVRESRTNDRRSCRDVALTALTRRLGERTPEHLIEQFKVSADDGFRGAVLLGLGELSYPGRPPYPGRASWSPEAFKTPQDLDKAAARTRKMAYPVLIDALGDPSPLVNTMAAQGLLVLARGERPIRPDLRAVEPLTRWCERNNRCGYPMTEYLAQHGDADTGRVLLQALKSQSPGRGDSHLVGAIGKLKPPGAVPVLDRNVRAHFAKYRHGSGVPRELDVLAAFGPEGIEALLAIFRDVDQLLCRMHTAKVLARMDCGEAAKPVAEFLRHTIAAGPANPKLPPPEDELPEKAYIRICTSLLDSLQHLDPPQAKQIAEEVIRNGPDSLRAVCLKVWAGD